MNPFHRLCVVAVAVLAALSGLVAPALAAVPAHDRFGNAKVATGIGYTDSVDVSDATAGRVDPTGCSNNASVWYAFTAVESQTINVNTSGSNYDTVLGVYTGQPGAFTRLACRDDDFTRYAALNLTVEAGTTYYFMVGACCGNGRDGQDFDQSLLLRFNMLTPLTLEVTAADTGTV